MKADAYGHGATELARVAERFSDVLCVASLHEAQELSWAGVLKPILVFSPFSDFTNDLIAPKNLVPVVSDIKDIVAFSRIKPAFSQVALKINTGMNRLGVKPREVKLAARLIEQAGFRLHSVFSHLYNASDVVAAQEQLTVFQDATKIFPQGVLRHIAASSSLYLPEIFALDAVRPGIALYGYGGDEVEPIQTIYAPILKIFSVTAGAHVSYGDYVAPRDMRVAVLGAGYADGIRRKTEAQTENRFVSVGGKLCPIVGQVCMDLTLADVSHVKKPSCGERAYFLGEGITGQAVADGEGTNIYEVLTTLFSGRIKRNYLSKNG